MKIDDIITDLHMATTSDGFALIRDRPAGIYILRALADLKALAFIDKNEGFEEWWKNSGRVLTERARGTETLGTASAFGAGVDYARGETL